MASSMTEARTITLGEKSIALMPIPLGRVRKLPVVCSRLYRSFALGLMDDAASDDILKVLSLGTGLTEAELDAIPATFPQLREAVDAIMDVAGLKPVAAGGASSGEVLSPATTQSAGGMTSTPTSSPVPDGPGTTLTSE